MSSTPPVLRSIDQLLGLADGGDYLPDLLDRIEAKAKAGASAKNTRPSQTVRCPADHPNLREVRGELRCYR